VTTLLDYARTEFPNRTLEVWQRDCWSVPIRPDTTNRLSGEHAAPGARSDRGSDSLYGASVGGATSDLVSSQLSLRDHTVVAHVVGAEAALDLMERLRAAGWSDTAAVLVCPTPPTVLPHGDEDPDSVTDLPDRRVVGAAVMGAVIAGPLGGAAGWIVGDEVATGLIFGAFCAVLGAVVGAMLGGLGRHAGERASSQPHVPGQTMAVVATFTVDEPAVARVVSAMEAAQVYDIRLVNASGSWRTPLT